jgi:hypothetical protein
MVFTFDRWSEGHDAGTNDMGDYIYSPGPDTTPTLWLFLYIIVLFHSGEVAIVFWNNYEELSWSSKSYHFLPTSPPHNDMDSDVIHLCSVAHYMAVLFGHGSRAV